MTRSRLYLILGIACLVGYSWLFYANWQMRQTEGVHLCFIRNVFNIPCPTCGSTHAVLRLFNGDISGAFYANPIGFIIFGIMIVLPPWLVYDLVANKSTLLDVYQKTEKIVRIKWIAAVLIALVLINWIWNFYKL